MNNPDSSLRSIDESYSIKPCLNSYLHAIGLAQQPKLPPCDLAGDALHDSENWGLAVADLKRIGLFASHVSV